MTAPAPPEDPYLFTTFVGEPSIGRADGPGRAGRGGAPGLVFLVALASLAALPLHQAGPKIATR